MYALTDYEASWRYPIRRILIIPAERPLSSGIQILLFEAHGLLVQMMVVTIGALRPLSGRLRSFVCGIQRIQSGVRRRPNLGRSLASE